MKTLRLTILLSLLAPTAPFALPPRQPSGGELLRDIERLATVGNVLYVAAHPDDENTRLLAYLVNEKHLRTAYLAVTRGDGGQNLIGSEQGPLLGLIRTQELLAARRIDGAEQFFTRAIDFGYSKTPRETLEIWGKDKILADFVWVIRSFKPDVILSRFSPSATDTHGHHTAGAMLSVEAFRAAADPSFHPEQVKQTGKWQAKRVLWNRGFFTTRPPEELAGHLKMEVGHYNPLLGRSYGEIAAESRSMHKSQGFGVASSRGPAVEYFQALGGEPARENLFDGIDTTWGRVPGSQKLIELLKKAKEQFRLESPHASIPVLLEVHSALQALPPNPWKTQKLNELTEVIISCAGLWLEVSANDFGVVPGQELKVTATALNRSPASIQLREIRFGGGPVVPVNKPLPNNEPVRIERSQSIGADQSYSNPYWLEQPPEKGAYTVSDPTLIGLPERPSVLMAEFVLTLGERTLSVARPLVYKWTDPVYGERYRPIEILPPVTINPSSAVLMFPDTRARTLRTLLKARAPKVSGTLRLELPEGWSAKPSSAAFKLDSKGTEEELTFQIQPPSGPIPTDSSTRGATLRFVAEVGGKKVSLSLIEVEHPHISIQTVMPPAEVKLVRFDLKRGKTHLGYIIGAGDEVPAALRQVGYDVTILGPEALENEPLNRFEAIVVGVRAYNTNPRMPFYRKKLMDYVSSGGTLLVQYNTSNFISRAPEGIGPYPFEISRDRVTDETAPVTFSLPAHSALQKPNKLTASDFEGWIQERGLYFAGKWDNHYQTPISMHDPGDPPMAGSLIISKFGKGAFIYTGLSFFRQLPAGVPGAYRLFSNLLSYGK